MNVRFIQENTFSTTNTVAVNFLNLKRSIFVYLILWNYFTGVYIYKMPFIYEPLINNNFN